MAKTILGNLLQTHLSGQKERDTAHTQVLKAISTYLSSHIIATGLFSGALTNPPFTPIYDLPSTNKIDSSGLPTQRLVYPSGESDWVSWCISLYDAIRSTCYITTDTNSAPVGSVLAFPGLLKPTWSQKDLSGVVEKEDPHGEAMDIMGNGIIKDLKSGYILSFPSTYPGGYTGVTNITELKCP